MTDKPEDKEKSPQVPTGVTRREAVAGGIAVVGTAAFAAATAAPANGSAGASADKRQPRAARGYFSSNGRMFIPRGQGFDATLAEFYEIPLEDPAYLEIWTYTDKISYAPGERVDFHSSTTGKDFSIEIIRDGKTPRTVHKVDRLKGQMRKLPPDFYEKGCGWPVSYSWPIPEDLPTGFYVVISRVATGESAVPDDAWSGPGMAHTREQEHGFFVRRAQSHSKADILFISSTCTWTAYNDWGGFSHYVGYDLPDNFQHAPRLSIQRPFAKGIIWSPEGSPRKPHRLPLAPNSIPVYPVIDFAYTRGYSKWFTNCGWATYERPFTVFAESNNYQMDYATQIDLHYDRGLLDGYKCVVIVGHCEYWSWEMREAIDRYVETGGNVARFAGNFASQIRLEDNGRTQIAYKDRALDSDPIRLTDQKRRITGLWEEPAVDWFGAETFGLNQQYGLFAHVGLNVPRGTGGFTVYRPDHWAFKGTDLYYGDDFGGDAKIFGYEVDGLDYTFRDGLPYPTFKDRAPKTTEILAMALACNTEADHGHKGSVFYYGDGAEAHATIRYGTAEGDKRAAGGRGNGMIVTFQRGKGTVFHAGSCEWVAGLKFRDDSTETITRNVLNRFVQKS